MKRFFLWFSGILLIVFTGLLLTGHIYAPELPRAEIIKMQEAIAMARHHKAQQYAGRYFNECTDLYDSVMKEWKLQNDRWILLRDYSKLKSLAGLATLKAVQAGRKSSEIAGNLRVYVDKNIEELRKRDTIFNLKFKRLPLERKILMEYSSAQLKLLEADEMARGNDLMGSFNKLVEAESKFDIIESAVTELLDSYFRSFAEWETWYNETLRNSATDSSSAIIIDKMAHKCLFVTNGSIIRQFDVELSEKWIGHKYHEGDNATPEGPYLIVKKLNSNQTKFHKALLINYPNEADKKRYREALRSGAIPGSVKIGGLIEIHGSGGKGKNWTNGCVALTDNDMDHLYSLALTGMPVTIVGSTVPLRKYLSE